MMLVSNRIGYKLPVSPKDQDQLGRWHASHAEKQLVIYTVWPLLDNLPPKNVMTDIWILVSRKVCNDCENFVQKVNHTLGMRSRLQVCTSSAFLRKQIALQVPSRCAGIAPSDSSVNGVQGHTFSLLCAKHDRSQLLLQRCS